MAYNPNYQPTAPPTGTPAQVNMDRDYINLPPGQKGYPPYPSGPGGDMPMMGYPQPQAPPPGYAYPPVPVPVQSEHAPITSQPTPGGYPPPPYGGGGYPPPQQSPYGGGGYPPPQQSPYGGGGGYPPSQQSPYGGQPPQNVGYAPQQPVMAQPMQAGYGAPGQSVPLNVPPGLEFLTQLDRLIVKQKVELLEAFLGCETKNKYKVKDSQGRDLYTAKEDTDCCTRNCCGSIRPFDIKVKDLSDREIIHLSRPFACGSCWFPCCLQKIEVFAPPGQLAGTVEQEWSLCTPQFVVKDAQGDVVLRIEGPMCTYSECGSVEFQIMSRDGGAQVGKISKKWSGLLREAFTDADNFGISFPIDLDVRMKAVMLGACFLIDFMFFEKTQNQEQDGLGML